ncbi:hypothetical protein [Arthrobacter oryzae]|uniref:hypothetical protein n=1 Tax=Arthrobacter oryzae TaxID=409290 RepID=UPI002783BDCB|nr:hypothetical protein [Arthrobacter oryzae]MDQ0076772.1 hypothetical protein [Arthrobacter oryzae]
MSAKLDKAAALLKNGGAKAKASGAKLHSLATDPEMQAKVRNFAGEGMRVYRAVTSPEAKQAYRQAAQFLDKARRKSPRR